MHHETKGAALNAAPFLLDSFAMRARFAPLPRAWLGYAREFTCERPTVRICAKCPDRAEAERQAKEARHDATHGLCPGCTVETFNEILAMNIADCEGARAAAQLLADSLGVQVSIYRRPHPSGNGHNEWKILPASENKPDGFGIENTVNPKTKEPSAGL